MRRAALAVGLLLVATESASAQSWVPWSQPGAAIERPRARAGDRAGRSAPTPRRIARAASFTSDDPPRAASGSGPTRVAIKTGHAPGTVVIDTSARRLYLMQSSGTALAYPISVGRDGFRWTGTKTITRVANWPDWRPPAEMRARQPNLPAFVPGGPRNPLGAKALYLGSSLYRIHGTNDQRSVGQANSSGCFRMSNGNVVDLASRVGVGTKVVVKSRL